MRKFLTWLVVCLTMVAWLGVAIASVPTLQTPSNDWTLYQKNDSQTQQKFALSDVAITAKPFTITSRLRLPKTELENSDSQAAESIWLAGVAGVAGQAPTLLTISWELDTSGWFPQWRLILRSDAGLLPSSQTFIELSTTTRPTDGNEYTTIFSYDPSLGVLSLRITDQSAEILYMGNIELKPYVGACFPGVGMQGRRGDQVTEIKEFTVLPVFVPIGASARLVTFLPEDGSPLGVRFVDRREKWGIELALPNRSLDNELRFSLEAGGARTELLSLDKAPTGHQIIPLSVASFPVGKADFIVEYLANGITWELSHTELSIGKVAAQIDHLNLATNADGKTEIAGVVQLSSDGNIPSFNVNIDYEINVPGGSTPLNQNWRSLKGSVVLAVPALQQYQTSVPVHLPLDSYTQSLVGKEVYAKLNVAADLDLPFNYGGLDRLVIGERTAVFPKVAGYNVLRGDFHSHTTLSDGDLIPADRVWESYMMGYDTVAITDHRSTAAYSDGSVLAQRIGLTLVKGFETGINKELHLVALGTDNTYQMRDEMNWAPVPNEGRAFYQDQASQVISHGGLLIYAHPSGETVPAEQGSGLTEAIPLTPEIEWLIKQGYLGGVEVKGNVPPVRRDTSFLWALKYGLTLFDASDVHGARNLSNGYRLPVTLVLTQDVTETGVIDALRNKRTLVWRDGELRGSKTWLIPFMDANLSFRLVEREGKPHLQITNQGALFLYGKIAIDGQGSQAVAINSQSTVYVPTSKDAAVATITWSNVFADPGKSLVTQHLIESTAK